MFCSRLFHPKFLQYIEISLFVIYNAIHSSMRPYTE